MKKKQSRTRETPICSSHFYHFTSDYYVIVLREKKNPFPTIPSPIILIYLIPFFADIVEATSLLGFFTDWSQESSIRDTAVSEAFGYQCRGLFGRQHQFLPKLYKNSWQSVRLLTARSEVRNLQVEIFFLFLLVLFLLLFFFFSIFGKRDQGKAVGKKKKKKKRKEKRNFYWSPFFFIFSPTCLSLTF